MNQVEQSVKRILESLPPGVTLVAAAKTRTPDEVIEAIRAGVGHVGHNYVQEAACMIPAVSQPVRWHMIGHLQTNKVKAAVQLFDLIETVDSLRLGQAIDRHCAMAGKTMPVLVEVNIGYEETKTGVLPENVPELVRQLSALPRLKVQGLMTMGPRFGNPEEARPYFRATRAAFEDLRHACIPNVETRYLSMGMSNSFLVAIEEGANMVRIGSLLFGERPAA